MPRNPNPPRCTAERCEAVAGALVGFAGDDALEGPLRAAFARHPRALEITSIRALGNARELARLLAISPLQCVRMLGHAPMLLYRDPEGIHANCVALADLLGMPLKKLIAAGLADASVFALSPDSVGGKVNDLAEVLGVPPEDCTKIYRKVPGLLCHDVVTLKVKAIALAELLGTDLKTLARMTMRRPHILARSTDGLAAYVDEASGVFGYSPETLSKILIKSPGLLMMRVDTMDRNVSELATLLGLKRCDVLGAAVKFPQVFYLKPQVIADKLALIEKGLQLAAGTMSEVFLRMPTLASRDPEKMIHHVRIVQRMARCLGESDRPEDILRVAPAAPTYSSERLLLRLLVAHLGLTERNWSSLVVMRDDAVLRVLEEHWSSLPVGSLAAARLRRLIDRRLPSA